MPSRSIQSSSGWSVGSSFASPPWLFWLSQAFSAFARFTSLLLSSPFLVSLYWSRLIWEASIIARTNSPDHCSPLSRAKLNLLCRLGRVQILFGYQRCHLRGIKPAVRMRSNKTNWFPEYFSHLLIMIFLAHSKNTHLFCCMAYLISSLLFLLVSLQARYYYNWLCEIILKHSSC